MTRKSTEGVKGPSALSKIVHNFVETARIDSIHCVYLGVTKLLMRCWFDPSLKDNDFSLRQYINYVDYRIRNINPPSFTPRLPWSVIDYYKYWKASELKNWLHYYSLVVLRPIMTDAYFKHHQLLVKAISLWSQYSISPPMIEEASTLLNRYVKNFQNLYGLRFMTYNLHLLRHLPNTVLNFG